MKIIMFLTSFFFCLCCLGQNKKVDSLNLLINSTKSDSIRLNLYFKLLETCEEKDNLKYVALLIETVDRLITATSDTFKINQLLDVKLKANDIYISTFETQKKWDKVLEYKFKKLEITKKLNNTEKITTAICDLGFCYEYQGNFPKAIEYYQNALAYAKEKKAKKGLALIFGAFGNLFREQGKFNESLVYYEKKLKIDDEIKDSLSVFNTYLTIGNIFSEKKNIQMAKVNYEKAKKVLNDPRNKEQQLKLYATIGNMYMENQNAAEAILSFKKSLSIANEINNNYRKINLLGSIGLAYLNIRDYTQSIEYNLKSLKIAEEIKDSMMIAWAQSRLAKAYMLNGSYKKAKHYSDISLKVIKNFGLPSYILDPELLACKIDSLNGNYKEALAHYQQHIIIKDSLRNDEVKKLAIISKLQNEYEVKRAFEQAEQEKKDIKSQQEIQRQKLLKNTFLISFFLVILLGCVILNSYLKKKKSNEVLSEKNKLIFAQKEQIKEKQKEILDSITYAKRLQEAILPSINFVNSNIKENFILFKPKDIVAGDFYWAEKINDLFFIAAADSTGHGVPGAMVSIVCSNALNRSIKEFKLSNAGKILDKTRELVLETFEKSTNEVKDGMDISLLCIDLKHENITWSGANNPLWYIQNMELKEIKADKQPVGKTDYPKPFKTHQIEFKNNTFFYLFTDGFADQFGGPKGKKFKYKQLEELFVSINNLTMKEQSELLNKKFEEWKGMLEQVDDVCVIGIKI